MITDDEFCGCGGLKSLIEEMCASGKVPHAVLLCGEEGSGRNLLARLWAAEYLGDKNRMTVRRAHPDCIEVRGAGVSGMIPVDAVRSVLYEVNKSAVTADGRRVIIIEDCANLNRSSSAALLKTLEQPPDGVVFLLTAQSEFDVSDTVRSRCAAFYIYPPAAKGCADYLFRTRGKKDSERISEYSALFRGRIGFVTRALDDRGFAKAVGFARKFAEGYSGGDMISMLSALDGAVSEKVLPDTLMAAEFCFAGNEDTKKTPSLRLLEEMRRDLTKNISPKLLSTLFVSRLARIAV